MSPFQKEIEDHYRANGWEYWSPTNIGLQIAEEAGEVCKAINHTDGAKQRKPLSQGHGLEDEIGQLCYALLCLCNVKEFDFDSIVAKAVTSSHAPAKEKHYGRINQTIEEIRQIMDCPHSE